MPSKSDSAGKLHQYYTVKQLSNIFPDGTLETPLNNNDLLEFHQSSFSPKEILSLIKIGELSAELIALQATENITLIKDIGVSSGVVGHQNTDDIEIQYQDGTSLTFSLKCAKGISQILSKNMGAKSLIKQYFDDNDKQCKFNELFDLEQLNFLNNVLKAFHPLKYTSIRRAKMVVNAYAKSRGLNKPRFGDAVFSHANAERNVFLCALRDNLINSIEEMDKSQIVAACNIILDTGKNHILADYRDGKEKVEYVNISDKMATDIKEIVKRGNDSVEIKTNDYKIGFRFKFESAVTSSIKLVGDYKKI
jgi:hypothetical protein